MLPIPKLSSVLHYSSLDGSVGDIAGGAISEAYVLLMISSSVLVILCLVTLGDISPAAKRL